MWKVVYYDILNNRELTRPEQPTRERALADACAFRKQHGKGRVSVIDPRGKEVPTAELDEFCRNLPP